MLKLDTFKIDLEAVEHGRWVDLEGGARIRVASLDCRAYEDAARVALLPHQRALRDGKLSIAAQHALIAPAVADHLLTGWEGLVDQDGAEVPFSREAARRLLTDPAYYPLLRVVLAAAADERAYRVQLREDTKGN